MAPFRTWARPSRVIWRMQCNKKSHSSGSSFEEVELLSDGCCDARLAISAVTPHNEPLAVSETLISSPCVAKSVRQEMHCLSCAKLKVARKSEQTICSVENATLIRLTLAF